MAYESVEAASVTTTDEIRSFVSRLAREYFLDGPDRRAEARFRVTLPVSLRLLDEDFVPLRYNVRAVTRDISESGLGLVCQDPVNAKHLSLQLSSPGGEQFTVFAEVLRCRPVGYYFDVGCKFITKGGLL